MIRREIVNAYVTNIMELQTVHGTNPNKICMFYEKMTQTTNKEVVIYEVVIKNLSSDFHLETKVTRVNRGVLLNLENPRYQDLIKQFDHLKGVTMQDTDTKE